MAQGQDHRTTPPLRPGHVWSIRAKLHLELRARDLALFNLAIDSKLRGCDLVALRVHDVAPQGYATDRANVRQSKTGRPVRFELTEQTRESLDAYLRSSGRKPGQVLFPGRGGPDRSLTARQYASAGGVSQCIVLLAAAGEPAAERSQEAPPTTPGRKR
jgi:integrase